MQQNRPKKVLIVDDDADILEFLQELLIQENYSVQVSDKAEPVEALYACNLPDLVLLDVLLSGKDGRDIVKHLKGQEQTRHIPVIMFSAQPGAAESTLLAGADAFIAKPFDIDEILSMIDEHINKRASVVE